MPSTRQRTNEVLPVLSSLFSGPRSNKNPSNGSLLQLLDGQTTKLQLPRILIDHSLVPHFASGFQGLLLFQTLDLGISTFDCEFGK